MLFRGCQIVHSRHGVRTLRSGLFGDCIRGTVIHRSPKVAQFQYLRLRPRISVPSLIRSGSNRHSVLCSLGRGPPGGRAPLTFLSLISLRASIYNIAGFSPRFVCSDQKWRGTNVPPSESLTVGPLTQLTPTKRSRSELERRCYIIHSHKMKVNRRIVNTPPRTVVKANSISSSRFLTLRLGTP